MLRSYEIHVLVSPKLEQAVFNGNVDPPPGPGWRPTLTVTTTGVAPRQPMWTACKRFPSDAAAQAYGKTLEGVRVKVERLGVPLGNVEGDEYLEAHAKIIMRGVDYAQLARICLEFGVQLLVNPRSNRPWPVTTMRRYDCSEGTFLAEHDKLLEAICGVGCEIHRAHLERGVLDTNPSTDQGWLFPHDGGPRDRITQLDCPERLVHP